MGHDPQNQYARLRAEKRRKRIAVLVVAGLLIAIAAAGIWLAMR
jgi:hypothetical protein